MMGSQSVTSPLFVLVLVLMTSFTLGRRNVTECDNPEPCPVNQTCCEAKTDEELGLCWPQTGAGQYATRLVQQDGEDSRMNLYCSLSGVWADDWTTTTASPDLVSSTTNSNNDLDNYHDRLEDLEINITNHSNDGTFHWEHYGNTLKTILFFLSITCAPLSLLIWIIVWVLNRKRIPYRYSVFVFIFTALTLDYCVEFFVKFPIIVRLSVFEGSYLFLNCALLLYFIFSVRIILRATLSGVMIAWSMIACVGFTILVTLLYIIIWFDFQEFVPKFPLVFMIPNLLLLFTVILLDVVIICFSFLIDNNRFTDSRDHRLIRHSCIPVFLLTVYLMSIEVLEILSIKFINKFDNEFQLKYYLVMNFMRCGVGFVFSVLLCFIDLEVLSHCPGSCIKLNDGQNSQEFLPLTPPEVSLNAVKGGDKYGTMETN